MPEDALDAIAFALEPFVVSDRVFFGPSRIPTPDVDTVRSRLPPDSTEFDAAASECTAFHDFQSSRARVRCHLAQLRALHEHYKNTLGKGEVLSVFFSRP